MTLEQRALRIIDCIYAAAVEPDRWQDVVQELSEAFDGACVHFQLNRPGDPLDGRHFYVGLVPEMLDSYAQRAIEGLPWAPRVLAESVEQFVDLGELLPEGVDLAQSDFYRTWMKPQKLAPVWPVGVTIGDESGIPDAGLSILRPRGGGPFGPDDLAFGDLIVPHLSRAMRIHRRISGSQRERLAMAEVMDRLPTGVVLLDAKHQAVSMNDAAHRILAQDDGISIDERGPRAADSHSNEAFQRLLASAFDPEPGATLQSGGFVAIQRPSGRRAFAVMITPLLAAPPGSAAGEAVVSLFIADPEAGRVSATQVLQTIYQLTPAEAELVQLLSQGHSLEEAAEHRGVTINTARGQLKQVFAKTDTKRQGELVRLVLTGVASLRER